MRNHFYIKYAFLVFFNVLFLVCLTTAQDKQYRLNTVVIDAGHGGKDPGATIGKAKEKNIVLDISLKVGSYITKNMKDVNVIYTRKKDVFVPLYKRADIANKNDADLFISIHANYCSAPYIAGTETFILGLHRSEENLEVAKKENAVILLEDDYNTRYEGFDPNLSESYIIFELLQNEYLEQSATLGDLIQNQFKNRVSRRDRGVKQAGFLVLRRTTMPGVLVEVGFMSNSSECRYLLSEKGRTYLASAIFRAFRDYKNKIENRSSYNVIPTKNDPPPASYSKNNGFLGIQIAASKRELELKPSNFKGIKDIHAVKSGKLIKYYQGNYTTYEDALKALKNVKHKYPDAFIIAIKDEKIVSLEELK